eukprot:4262303-Amphidinium_carterae.1
MLHLYLLANSHYTFAFYLEDNLYRCEKDGRWPDWTLRYGATRSLDLKTFRIKTLAVCVLAKEWRPPSMRLPRYGLEFPILKMNDQVVNMLYFCCPLLSHTVR